jgi:putative flippase GtrA
MKHKVVSLLTWARTSDMGRYFVMAAVIVSIELAVFAFINSILGLSYVIATPGSMAVSFVLNWYFSKHFVFAGKSRHKAHVEFTLVLITSLVGVGLQLAVTGLFVEILGLLPIIGKLVAIIVTFFWNFIIRKKFIFNNQVPEIVA